MVVLLSIVAIIIAIVGVMRLAQGDIVLGIILLVVACAVGPGGWAIWR